MTAREGRGTMTVDQETTQEAGVRLADLQRQLQSLRKEQERAVNEGNIHKKHVLDQQEVELLKTVHPVELSLRRADVGTVFEGTPDDELAEILEAQKDRAEELGPEVADTSKDTRPRLHARLTAELEAARTAIVGIEREMELRKLGLVREAQVARGEVILAEQAQALEALKKLQWDVDVNREATRNAPWDQRAKLDLEDALKKLAEGHQRFHTAQARAPWPKV
jgi:hypothetical protein